MKRPQTLWEQLKASAAFIKGSFLDDLVIHSKIETPLGPDFLECQVRSSRKSGERYVVLKSTGGEATVYVPLDEEAARQLVHFIEQSFLHNSSSLAASGGDRE